MPRRPRGVAESTGRPFKYNIMAASPGTHPSKNRGIQPQRPHCERPHRGPSQWLAVACEMSVLSTQTGSGMVAVLLIPQWKI